MLRGIRLTTGAEFAKRDAPKTPVQLRPERSSVAREFFPLAERRDEEPWMGARPCTPDMMPVIGKAPRHEGLWFAFGHAHHGMTLGPVTGRALAEKMTGEKTVIDIELSPGLTGSWPDQTPDTDAGGDPGVRSISRIFSD